MGATDFSLVTIAGTQTLSIEVEEEYVCQYCDDEITLDQVKKSIGGTVSSKRVENINRVLPFMNKYRKDFGLDTCLRKAHFIAQVIHESNRFHTFEEYEKRTYKKSGFSLPGVFSNKSVLFDETMGESLKEHLYKIFKLLDKDDKVLVKTNAQIKDILIEEKVKVVDKKLYPKYNLGDELLKEVKEKIKKDDGTEEEQVKYKIYLQDHDYYGIPMVSRMYAPYEGDTRGLGNGDELSRDGWKFKGRGLKQLTGKGNYQTFKAYRDANTFTGDDTGAIDFTLDDPSGDVKKGNYIKISENPMYATQSALYFWNDGTKYRNKHAKEHADDDSVTNVSKAVNLYDTGGLSFRKKYYKNARKKDAFDIVRHYKDIYDNGTDDQKEESKAYFEKWKDDDEKAKEILEGIEAEASAENE